jgi:peptidoglycan/LPS O-acetylase OafA/YrhL
VVTGAHVTEPPTFRQSSEDQVVATAPGSAPPALPIQPAFDGMRGVAVLGVLAAHLGEFLVPNLSPWPLRGGFLGVDVFFVLSGFLITSLLLRELERSGAIRFGRFYLRRAQRLVPALLGLLAAHWIYAAIEGFPMVMERRAALYALTFSSNWQPTWGIDAGADVPLDLSHLWSLGVEGQFYLVWPLLFLGLYRLVPSGRRMIAVMAGAIVAIAIVRVVELNAFDGWALVYTRFDARADALLVGAVLAVALARGLLPSRRVLHWLAIGGGAVLAVALVVSEPSTGVLYWGGFTVVSISAAAIVSLTLERHGRLARALSWSPIRSIGLASYSIYLWHLPVYLWAVRVIPEKGLRIAVALFVTAVFSTISYRLLERPYMARRGRLVPSSTR